jgi:conflict system STAND superfamily ATPase
VAGLGVEEAFVHQAARDAETEDALPLLAFALRALLDRSGGDKHLSLDEYKALGDEAARLNPLENAVRQAADEVLADARPGDDELTALRDAFVPAMVRVNDQGEYARRPARLDELPAKSHPLLERLAKARLLIMRQDGDACMVEVAHEALLRKWPRLRAWLDDARAFLIGKQQLEQDLRDWERAPQADRSGALLSGLKLSRARTWLAERPHQLAAQERAFIQASIQAAEAEERRKVRLRRNITRGSVAAALVLACVAALAGFQWLQARVAKDQAVVAKNEAVVAKDQAVAEGKRALAAEAAARAEQEKTLAEQQKTLAEQQKTLAAQEEKFVAQENAARDLIRYTWIDLGAKQAEIIRLTDVAKKLKRSPDELLPDIICANKDCTETKKQQPGEFDCGTYLKTGFRYTYCLVRSVLSFDKVQAISGLNIFRPGGPHDNGELNLNDPLRFGHYNPMFLDWVDKHLIPDRSEAWFKGVTQNVYDAYIAATARALYHAHEILFAEPKRYRAFEKQYQIVKNDYLKRYKRGVDFEMFERDPIPLDDIKAGYLKRIAEKNDEIGSALGDDLSWLSSYLSNYPAFQKGDDLYIASNAAGFWVRRSIDGTEPQIFRMLKKLLLAFDPTVVGKP